MRRQWLCKRCGATQWGEEDLSAAQAESEVRTAANFPEGSPIGMIGPERFRAHHCEDGALGIAEYVGAGPADPDAP